MVTLSNPLPPTFYPLLFIRLYYLITLGCKFFNIPTQYISEIYAFGGKWRIRTFGGFTLDSLANWWFKPDSPNFPNFNGRARRIRTATIRIFGEGGKSWTSIKCFGDTHATIAPLPQVRCLFRWTTAPCTRLKDYNSIGIDLQPCFMPIIVYKSPKNVSSVDICRFWVFV